MRNTMLAMFALAALLAGCGGGGVAAPPSESPDVVVKSYMTAMLKGDTNAMVECMASAEQAETRQTLRPLDKSVAEKSQFEISETKIEGNRATVSVRLKTTDDSRPPFDLPISCVKEGAGWRVTEAAEKAAARLSEAHAALGTLKDRLRVFYVKNNNNLPNDLTLDKLLAGRALDYRYYGSFGFELKGNAQDNFKGTTFTAKPRTGVDSPVVTLTILNVQNGDSTISP